MHRYLIGVSLKYIPKMSIYIVTDYAWTPSVLRKPHKKGGRSMKTQGITLMTSTVSEVKVTKKTTKASDSTFDNFISNSAAGVNSRAAGQNANIADTKSSMDSKASKIQSSKKSEDGSSSNITQSKDAKNEQVNKTDAAKTDATQDTADAAKDTTEVAKTDGSLVKDDGTIDIEKVSEEIMTILQDVLNLMPQDVQDIFDGMGMEPTDLITGLYDGSIESFSITTVQVFVMEVHGIEDPSAIITNDLLNSEMNDIFDKMKSLLSELMRVGAQDLEKLDPAAWEDFAGQIMQLAHPVVAESEAGVDTGVNIKEQPLIEGTDQTDDSTPDMSIVIENRTSDQAGSGTGQQTGQGTGLASDDVRDTAADLRTMENQAHTTNAQAFAEVLTEAIEPDATQATDVQRQMTEMVEQVVRQVRIRMMPESTNMELQLHPASLGRVNVQINATGQETTARLIVETQAAKEALESGMIRLQEAFDERGIKVQAIEVTVGNFDLGLQDQAGDQAENPDGGRRGSRNGRNAGSDEAEIDAVADNVTEA